MLLIEQNLNKINSLCVNHKVEKLFLFGSATNDSFTSKSDIDFLVKFDDIDLKDYFNNYVTLKIELRKIFEREIDLIEVQTLKNPILIRSIERSKELIYG